MVTRGNFFKFVAFNSTLKSFYRNLAFLIRREDSQNDMKKTCGFIQIPLLFAIIVCFAVVGWVGYLGVNQYQNKQQANLLGSATQEKVIEQDNQVVNTNELSEVEKLRQEIDELKEQQSSPVSTQKNGQASIATVENGENFRENAIIAYKQTAEFFRRAIEETRNSYIPDIKDRRDKLTHRVNLVRETRFTNSGDGAVLNEMLDLFAQEHNKEVKFIDEVLVYIESNLISMTGYQIEYDRNVSLLLADNKKVVTRVEIMNLLEHESVFLDIKYKYIENIGEVMRNYYQSVMYYEGQYAEAGAIIRNAFSKISEPTNEAVQYYQPLPQINTNLTTRQQLLLNPIRCAINHDQIQTTVTCY